MILKLEWNIFVQVVSLVYVVYVFTVLFLVIIIVGSIERKIDTNPLMCLSPTRESPGTDMG